MHYLILTSLMWAFSYSLIKNNLTNLDAGFVSACRMVIAALVFLPFLNWKNLKLKAVGQLMLIGAIQYGLMYLFFIRAFSYLAAHQVALFTTLTPLYVILINDILARKIRAYYLVTAFLAALGGMLIYYQNLKSAHLWQGFLLMQAADLSFAFGQIAYKRFRQKLPQVKDSEIYAWLFIGAAVITAIATTKFHGWYSLQKINFSQSLVLLYLGAIASGLGFFWWNKGAVTTDAGVLAVFNNLKSPLAILVSVMFFHEKMNMLTLTSGLILIVIALWLANLKAPRH